MKKIVIIFIVLVIIFLSCYILINNSQKEIIKLCISEIENDGYITQKSYQLWIDSNNNVTKIKELKEYIYEDKPKYFYKIHDLRDKDINIASNDETNTISIYGYEGELIDENGDTILISFDEYFKNNMDESYICKKM